jgi:transposase
MFSEDLRWRAITLIYVYNQPDFVSELLGVSVRAALRWYAQFKTEGTVIPQKKTKKTSRYSKEVIKFIESYCSGNPTFFIEELKVELRNNFPELRNTSDSTICRALKFDLNLSRKVLTKRAREASPQARKDYIDILKKWYRFPEQLVFVDETSKDGRDAMRRYARSRVNTPAIVRVPFSRGKRVSCLAAINYKGFIGFDTTPGTFTRGKFHESFKKNILTHLKPWPLPQSIVIMDNAKIHAYPELYEMIHSVGAKLIFLPPYSPELNPIEICFSLLKRYVQKHFSASFRKYPVETLEVCLKRCTESHKNNVLNIYAHCGYNYGWLDTKKIQQIN